MSGGINDQRTIQLAAILKGLIVSLIILILSVIILGILYSIFNVFHDELLSRILLVVNYLAIFGGGIFTARNAHNKGWLNGGLVGLLYMLLILFFGAQVIAIDFGLDILLRVISGFLAGAVGGIIGVNIK